MTPPINSLARNSKTRPAIPLHNRAKDGERVVISEPLPTHFTVEPSGDWIPWSEVPRAFGAIFAIRFNNGRILDPISGWSGESAVAKKPNK